MDKKFLLGAGVVLGAMLLVPGLAASLARAGRPLARAAVKTGAVAWTEFRKAGAEAYEHMEDLAAEFQAEATRHEKAEGADEAVSAAPPADRNG